jgi:hypothetical protein
MIYKFLKYQAMHKTILSLFMLLFVGQMSLIGNTGHPTNDPGRNESKEIRTIFDKLKQGKEVLDVTIEFDMAPLMENRYNEKAQKATFIYKDLRKNEVQYEVKASLRGKYRRRVCEFPPLMIKFPKKDLKAEGLSDHNDLKLVTHCIDDKLVGNENVIKEYLLYRMFNELTPYSYRVQLLKVTYKDVNNNYPKVKRWAFLIEDTDEMAERLGGEECEKCLNIPTDSINTANENLVALFQFMIGNADWSSVMDRNIKFVNRSEEDKKLIVPYDFDFSGMVNASYALPSTDYGLTSIKDRVFLGREVSEDVFASNIRLFLEKKKTLYNILHDCKLLNTDARFEMLDYMDTFYACISDVDFNKEILPQLAGEEEEANGSDSEYIINRNNSGK